MWCRRLWGRRIGEAWRNAPAPFGHLTQSELWCSPLSVWEISLLQRKGRVRLNCALHDWILALGATAKHHRLTLVTADRKLLARQDIATLAAA